MFYIAGEDIAAGDSIVISFVDGKAYRAGRVVGALLGNAVEQLREGFRVIENDGEVREDGV